MAWEIRGSEYNGTIFEVGSMVPIATVGLATEMREQYRAVGNESRDPKTDKGNGQLILAAPDLLAALQSLFEHCAMTHKHWGEGCNREQANAAQQSARAAIAKATGN